MCFKTKMNRAGRKVLAGIMTMALALSPAMSLPASAAGTEQSGTGDKGVTIKLNAAQTETEPGGEINYTVTVSTTEYTGAAEVVLTLGEGIIAKEVSVGSDRTGTLTGQDTSTVTLNMTDFKPADNEIVLTVKADTPDDLTEDTVKDATAVITYDTDKSATAGPVPVTVKKAYPTTGAASAKVTMEQTSGSESVVPGTKVSYKLSAELSSEIPTVTTVEGVKLHMDIPAELTDVEVAGYKNDSPVTGSFADGTAAADFGTVNISDKLEMTVDVTIPEDYTYRDFTFNGYASGTEVTSDNVSMQLKTTEVIERLQDEPSVYMAWKDLNSTKERTFRNNDVLPVSIVVTNRDADKDMQDVSVTMDVPEGFNVAEDLNAEGILSDKTTFTWHVDKIDKNGGKFTVDLGFVPTAGDAANELNISALVSYKNYPLDKSPEIRTNELKAVKETPEADVLDIKVMQNNTENDIVVSAGQNVAYSVTATNNGDVDLKNVVIEGEIGSGLIYGKSNKSTAVQKDGVMAWTIDTLKAGKSQTMLFGVTLPKSGMSPSYSFVMEGNADDIAESKSNTVTMKTGKSSVVIEMYQKKSGMDEGTKDDMTVEYGEIYTYVIVVKNEGAALAENTVVTTTIPGSLTVNQSSLPRGMTYNSSSLKWDISDLEAGGSKKATFKVTAPVTPISTNTSSNSKNTAKKMTLNVNSSVSWTDAADNPGDSDSNTVVTVVEKKEDNESDNNDSNNTSNTSDNNTKPVNNSGLDIITASKTTGTNMAAYQDSEVIVVTAKYTKLQANTHYTGTVGLVNGSGGVVKRVDGTDATAHVDFTTSGTSGTIGDFEFVIDGKAYAGKSIYGAIDVTPDNGQKRSYNGKDFDKSTIRFAAVTGAAVSSPTVSTSKTAKSSVTVSYANVQPGLGYQIVAALIDRSTGKPVFKADGKDVRGMVEFKASAAKGQIDVPFSFGSEDTQNKDLAVYVTLYDANGKAVLATDHDMNTGRKSDSAFGNNSASSNKGDSSFEIVKTGETDSTAVILILAAVCAASGAGYYLSRRFKNKQQ